MKNVYTRSFESAPPPRNIGYSRAFTLAEVLITLGIIGVVAALTIPTLISKYQEKQTIVKLKKVYSILQNAYTAAEAEYDKPRYWSTPDYTEENNIIIWEILTKNISNKKKCNKNCFPTYKNLKGQTLSLGGDIPNYLTIVLPDGAVLSANFPWQTRYVAGDRFPVGPITVDLNGLKGPNIAGKDYFRFWLTHGKGILPCGAQIYPDDDTWIIGMQNGNNGSCFTGWVLQNENMDYLKCKDFTKFTWSHPSCD